MGKIINLATVAVLLGAALAAEEPPGQRLYQVHCASCHGASGAGDGPAAAGLEPPVRNLRQRPYKYGCNPRRVFHTLTQGVPGTAMPSFQATLSEEERRQIADYVFSLGREGGCNCDHR